MAKYADEYDVISADTVSTGNTEGGAKSAPQYILQTEDGSQVSFYSMLEMGIKADSQIPTEYIEKGSFTSYNKVIDPLESTCKLALTGEESEIQDALNALDDLQKSENKIEFITPFETYENFMLESYDYRRDGNSGHDVLQVEIRLKEIREVEVGKTTRAVTEPPPVEVSETKDGSCASTVDYGQVQTTAPTQAEQETAEGGKKQSILYQIFN